MNSEFLICIWGFSKYDWPALALITLLFRLQPKAHQLCAQTAYILVPIRSLQRIRNNLTLLKPFELCCVFHAKGKQSIHFFSSGILIFHYCSFPSRSHWIWKFEQYFVFVVQLFVDFLYGLSGSDEKTSIWLFKNLRRPRLAITVYFRKESQQSSSTFLLFRILKIERKITKRKTISYGKIR